MYKNIHTTTHVHIAFNLHTPTPMHTHLQTLTHTQHSQAHAHIHPHIHSLSLAYTLPCAVTPHTVGGALQASRAAGGVSLIPGAVSVCVSVCECV